MSISSPCISICVLDDEDVCQGCFRTADEITQWSSANEEAQQRIVDLANNRRLASQEVTFK